MNHRSGLYSTSYDKRRMAPRFPRKKNVSEARRVWASKRPSPSRSVVVGAFPRIIVYQHEACAANLITWRMPVYPPHFWPALSSWLPMNATSIECLVNRHWRDDRLAGTRDSRETRLLVAHPCWKNIRGLGPLFYMGYRVTDRRVTPDSEKTLQTPRKETGNWCFCVCCSRASRVV